MVHEMHTYAVHIGHSMIETVEPLLLRPPVEPVGPVLQQSTKVVKVNALRPRPPRRRIGPARASNALPQIVENCVGHRHDERLDAHPQMIASVIVHQRSTGSRGARSRARRQDPCRPPVATCSHVGAMWAEYDCQYDNQDRG